MAVYQFVHLVKQHRTVKRTQTIFSLCADYKSIAETLDKEFQLHSTAEKDN